MPIVDNMTVLAGGMRPPARQGRQLGPTDEDREPVVVEAHPEAMTDQARRHGVEHLAKHEPAGRGDAHARLFVIGGTTAGERRKLGALDVYTLAVAGVDAPDDLVDEAAISGQIVERARAPHQESVLDRALEMAMRPFDCAVLMGDPGVVARGRHAVVAAQVFVATRQILPRILVEITESG